MKRKYFFFDIDGTLTDDATHRIVPSAQEALRRLQEAGHFVAVASGRMHYKTKAFTDSVGIHNLVCGGGGCLVIDDQIIDQQYLENDKTLEFLKHCDENGIGWLITPEDSDCVIIRDFRFLEQAGRRRELTTYLVDPKLDPASLPGIMKIYVAVPKGQEDRYPWLDLLGHLRMTDSYLVIQYDKKKEGILRMMEYMNADPADVVVFGDEKNDLVMFDPRWMSIAMGNAVPELKEKADYITAANTDDGILKACEHFGWI